MLSVRTCDEPYQNQRRELRARSKFKRSCGTRHAAAKDSRAALVPYSGGALPALGLAVAILPGYLRARGAKWLAAKRSGGQPAVVTVRRDALRSQTPGAPQYPGADRIAVLARASGYIKARRDIGDRVTEAFCRDRSAELTSNRQAQAPSTRPAAPSTTQAALSRAVQRSLPRSPRASSGSSTGTWFPQENDTAQMQYAPSKPTCRPRQAVSAARSAFAVEPTCAVNDLKNTHVRARSRVITVRNIDTGAVNEAARCSTASRRPAPATISTAQTTPQYTPDNTPAFHADRRTRVPAW